jgi:hypothetical protein
VSWNLQEVSPVSRVESSLVAQRALEIRIENAPRSSSHYQNIGNHSPPSRTNSSAVFLALMYSTGAGWVGNSLFFLGGLVFLVE